ncbi:MAG TPA: hypothetical protein VG961_09625 [Ignavibacteria bacterium]|nr:hypothetical protein [Ignavibacteria bacterium]
MNKFYRILSGSILTGFLFLQGYSFNNPAVIYFNDSLKYNDSLTYKDSVSAVIDSIGIKKQQIAEGRKLYEKKCGRCHMLHEPGEYKIKQWKRNLNEMQEKAELKNNEYNLILGYLSENAKK